MTTSVSKEDRIIVLMGPTGVGKSTFIETTTQQNGTTIGHRLQSFTSDIRSVRYTHPTQRYPMVFVDTPGFDDTFKSDTEILGLITEWLMKVYQGKVKVAGILYLHRITDNRMSGSCLRNLQVFEGICGDDAGRRIRLVTTMWGDVREDVGRRREHELENHYWKDVIAAGARTARFYNTVESAWSIIDQIPGLVSSTTVMRQGSINSRISAPRAQPIQIQREIVDEGLKLKETEAGVRLHKALEKLLEDQKQANRRLEELAGRQDSELLVQQLHRRNAEIEENIHQVKRQIHQLRLDIMQRFRRFLRRR